MSDELNDDQSHYEISLTAGQAFLAFVLLLLSLAASFAFGLMIGKGQNDERLIVRKEPAVITEASAMPKKKDDGRIVELGVNADDFKQTTTATSTAPVTDSAAPAPTIITEAPKTATAAPAPVEGRAPRPSTTGEAPVAPQETPVVHKAPAPTNGSSVYAQLLSSSDQKTAEALAAKVIGAGFTGAYVDRGSNEKGAVFRVRVKFGSEAEARAAETKLREYAKDVWIVK